MPDLSVIIPSHNDIYLHKTVYSLLDHAEGDVEIIPVFDGYVPQTPLKYDARIRPEYHVVNRGMRESINTGVAAATSPYIMRVDEHCMFGQGYDKIILDTIQPNWIVVPRRYFLDPVSWRRMDELGYVDYEKLKIIHYERGLKFSGVPWESRTKERKDTPVDETMAMQGSCWIMPKRWWESVIVRLDTEGYGPHLQDSHEMVFKTWQSGGKLMINKLTWYAHKHRNFPRTHSYGGADADASYAHSLKTWAAYYDEIRKNWGI